MPEVLAGRMSRVSVCVPLFNHRRYIEALLDSVQADPYPNKELVVIDDGSTDGSFEAIQEWRERVGPAFPCNFVRQANAGTAETANRLLAAATGDYCAIVASDDVLVPGGLLVRQSYLENHPELFAVFGDARVIDAEGKEIMASGLTDLYHADKRRYHDAQALLFQIVVRWSVPGPVLMVRRKALMAFGGFSPDFLEDFDLYVRLADQDRLGFVDSVVAEYRLHGTNVSRSGDSLVRIRQLLIKTCLKNLGTARTRTSLYLLIRLVMSQLQKVAGWRGRRSVGFPAANT
jgi:glycosyltransferase involved in cell wall biosynthesis